MYSSNQLAKVNPAVLLILVFGIAVIAVFTVMVMTEDPAPRGEDDGDEAFSSLEVVGASGGDSAPLLGEERRIKVPVTSAGEDGEAATAEGLDNLRGVVVDETGAPVAGAEIKAIRTRGFDAMVHPLDYRILRTVSGEDGNFSFKGIPSGHYSLCAVWNNLAGGEVAFAASRGGHPEGSLRTYEIVLWPAGVIEGRVITGSGEPVPGAMVVPVGMTASFTETDAQGRFSFERIRAGMYTVVALAGGYAPESDSRVITGKRDVELVLGAGGSISGRVLLDGRPQPGVKVAAEGGPARNLMPMEAVSGEDGIYRLTGLAASWYHLRVVSDRYAASDHEHVELSHGEKQENMDFVLKEAGGLAGRVLEAGTGEPVAGTWVTAFQAAAKTGSYVYADGAPVYTRSFHQCNTRTDKHGSYRLPSLAPTEYRIGVRCADGLASALWEEGRIVKVEPGKCIEEIDFDLERGAEQEVLVRTDSGKPVERARVTVRDEQGLPDLRGLTLHPPADELGGGSYRVAGLGPNTYRIKAMKSPLKSESKSVTLAEGEAPPPLEIVLESGRELTGRVVDPDGRGIAGAYVGFQNDWRAVADEKGAFKVSGVPSRLSWVSVYAEGYFDATLRNVRADEGEEVVFTLEPIGDGHRLAGIVENDLGKPLAGVTVSAWQQTDRFRVNESCTTGEDGRFRMDGLADLPAVLSVDSSEGKLDEECKDAEVDRKDLKLVVNRYARVKGRVHAAEGEPVEAFRVRIKEKKEFMGNLRFASESFYDAAFDLGNIPCGEVTLVASTPDGMEGESDPLTLEPGEVREGVVIKLKEQCSLSGTVMSRATAEPVPGAGIHIEEPGKKDRMMFFMPNRNPKATTGDDGTFSVKNLKPGRVTVRVSHKDFMECKVNEVELVTGETTGGLEIFLEKGGSISGCVRMDGLPKAGVQLRTWTNRESKEDVTDQNGMYRLENLPPGSHQMTASIGDWGEDQKRVERTVILEQGQDLVCDLSFEQGGTLAGTVYRSSKPQPEAQVHLYPAEQDGESRQTASAVTGSDGAYEISGLPPGKYRLYTSLHNEETSLSKSDEVEIMQGTNHFDIELSPEGTGMISGHVYGIAGPEAEMRVHCSAGGGSQTEETDENGFFRFKNLSAGWIHLSVSRFDWKTGTSMNLSLRVELAAGEAVERDIHLRTGTGVVSGKVLSNGKPVEEAHISINIALEGTGENMHVSARVESGSYRAEKLPAGKCTVMLAQSFLMSQVVDVADGRESVADFDYEQGTAAIEGTLRRPEESEKKSYATVLLYNPGACALKVGESFKQTGISDGVYTQTHVDKEGKIRRIDLLPAKDFDVVAVLVEEGKVVKTDVRRITLRDRETTQVSLDLGEPE